MGKTAIIIVLILIAVGVGVYFLKIGGKIPSFYKKTESPSLGEQIYAKTQNPLEGKLPETNPFSKLNPFKGVYKNPFE